MDSFRGIGTSQMKIEKFIFHVVHHGNSSPILLNETPIDGHEAFFLGRLQDTLSGNRFIFDENSPTLKALLEIKKDPNSFVDVSKRLAISFHQAKNENIKPGVMMLMLLSAGHDQLFAIIKYDHQEVLRYQIERDSKGVLEEIKNTFTKSKKSLHKSAIVKVNEKSGDLMVIDQKVRHDISQFFKSFLGVRRLSDKRKMTETIGGILTETIKKHRAILPKTITENLRGLWYDYVAKTEIFDFDSFFQQIFGPYGSQEIRKTLETKMAHKDLNGEHFELDKEAVKAPRKRKYETAEGVTIQYGETASSTVQIQRGQADQPTQIIITTQKLIEQ